ncbi:hypothetical protein EU805_14260 [Salipiger sp. IMCC34102]|uniref:ChaN family lipoprotein n=1 Tax=Salipiger sp. IMCC34102 TaxID=2510647 RepID=UPI00101D4F2F|nr:ChaN family lipoprotein [Salipiger sp. IMCC34102]RYH01415.1 hypothetical protein EU805_14260 [Salipiger sp. IMCC34102]
MRRLLALLCCATPAVADVGPLPRADIYVLGETHDNPAHHAVQAELVARVAPAALVFEMIAPEDAAAGAGIDRSDGEALAEAYRWDALGWPDFAMYHPIFEAAPDAQVIGAQVGREDLASAMRSSAEDVLGVGVVGFNLWPRSGPVMEALIADQRAAHCDMLPEDMLPGMVEAQRLRDAMLALAARDAVDDTGGPVVVITGNGHARTDTGVPFVLDALSPDLAVWALGQFEEPPEPGAPFDATAVSPPVDRGAPCATFR